MKAAASHRAHSRVSRSTRLRKFVPEVRSNIMDMIQQMWQFSGMITYGSLHCESHDFGDAKIDANPWQSSGKTLFSVKGTLGYTPVL